MHQPHRLVALQHRDRQPQQPARPAPAQGKWRSHVQVPTGTGVTLRLPVKGYTLQGGRGLPTRMLSSLPPRPLCLFPSTPQLS